VEGVVFRLFPVALARGKHLFPFRTEQLSPSAPMVLGPQGPGRVGRRRFFRHASRLRAARRSFRTKADPCEGTRLALDGARAAGDLPRAAVRPPRRLRLHGNQVVHGGDAVLWSMLQLPWAARSRPSAQRRSVGVLRVAEPLLVDLPVDVVVVLEHQECTGHAKPTERALRKLRFVRLREHVFVRYEPNRTDPRRTGVRIVPGAGKRL
jgi:hypothetical protein